MVEVQLPDELVRRVIERRGRLHCFDELEPRRTALVVVDMQTAFLKPEWPTSLAAARDIVPTVNRLARVVRQTGGQVVWIVSTYGPRAEDRWGVLFDHILGPEAGAFFREVLSEGHEGHAIWPELEVGREDAIVAKNRFSGFCGSDGRLERLLRERALDTLLIAGTVTNVCCEFDGARGGVSRLQDDHDLGRQRRTLPGGQPRHLRDLHPRLRRRDVERRGRAAARGGRTSRRRCRPRFLLTPSCNRLGFIMARGRRCRIAKESR